MQPPVHRTKTEQLATAIATVFHLGEVAPWPGHYATLVTVPLAVLLHWLGPWPHLVVTLLLLAVGTWAAERYSDLTGKHDHRAIVIDEVVGYLVTVWLAPWHFLSFFFGYFLFRVLDGLKPGPLRWLDRHVKGGFGVMIDDVAAGAVAALILHWLVPWTAPPLFAMLQRLW
ncbi:MAG: phosphatidylglycerophosphatase A [Myxococcales bacterium]|nr:phosphatidylglycerophosphatase A [Myxococcales bacterium]